MMYRHHALITGRGAFPVDMLRYDAAYPASSQDVLEIVNSLDPESGNRKYWVHMSKRTDAKIDTFTAGRWQSFGATVESITTEKR
jgi:hypothetical protein